MNFTKFYELISWLNKYYIATWLGSIGTVGTLIFTLKQLHIDRNERKEIELKSRAKDVSAWITKESGNYVIVRLNNLSNAPIYSVILTLVCIQGTGGPEDGKQALGNYEYRNIFFALPPGKLQTKMPYGGRGMSIRFGIEIAFTDSNGKSWVRKSNGKLAIIKQKTTEYYNLFPPFSEDKYEEIID